MSNRRSVIPTIIVNLIATPVAFAEEETVVIDIPNAVVIAEGILGGGQPDEAALRRAAEAGYRTIVDMRLPGEERPFEDEAAFVRSLGMEYVALPVSGADAYSEANARRLAEVLAGPSALPAVVHCRSGNRVGVLFAAKAFYVDGIDGAEAIELGKRAGARRISEEMEASFREDEDD